MGTKVFPSGEWWRERLLGQMKNRGRTIAPYVVAGEGARYANENGSIFALMMGEIGRYFVFPS